MALVQVPNASLSRRRRTMTPAMQWCDEMLASFVR
jgi:hypothetical protein